MALTAQQEYTEQEHPTCDRTVEDFLGFFTEDRKRELAEQIFEAYPGLLTAPAAKGYHHAWFGGLWLHLNQMVDVGLDLINRHSIGVNRNDLLLGILLHDLDKVFRYRFDDDGKIEYIEQSKYWVTPESIVFNMVEKVCGKEVFKGVDPILNTGIIDAVLHAHGGWSMYATHPWRWKRLDYALHICDLMSSQLMVKNRALAD